MGKKNELRKRIEENIGREMLKKIGNGTSGPIMIPSIPDSKFIGKLPEGVLEGVNAQEKNHQDSYEAEVRLYRCFEEIKTNCLVIHQLEFTHEQYSAFLPEHGQCIQNGCTKKPENHPCHKQPKQVEGECDFVVVGDNFVAVFEVKGLHLQDTANDEIRFKGCCESAKRQRKRMKALIHSICPSTKVCEFTVFPNISYEEVGSWKLKDRTMIFKNRLDSISTIINNCATNPTRSRADAKAMRRILSSCLLGLWCIDRENKWDLCRATFPNSIKEIDQKLRKALVTRKSIDDAKKAVSSSSKGKKRKEKAKKYPQNPEMTEAPDIFKQFLNINCLTKDQMDVFHCQERFLWVDGPAGSGKTVVMLGKIIDIVQKDLNSRVLVIIAGHRGSPVLKNYIRLLSNVASCQMVSFDYYDAEGDLGDNIAAAHRLLLKQLSKTNAKIVFLGIRSSLVHDGMYDIFSKFSHVLFDDFQCLFYQMSYFNMKYKEYSNDKIISEGLVPIIKYSSGTSLWVFYDIGQCALEGDEDLKITTRCLNEIRSYFSTSKVFSINLRNTYEISSVLSIMRQYQEQLINYKAEDWPLQKEGHFLRATKIKLYLLSDDNPHSWSETLNKELVLLKGHESSLQNKDIAILYNIATDRTQIDNRGKALAAIKGVLEKWETSGDAIAQHTILESMSAEWPATITICRYQSHATLNNQTFALTNNVNSGAIPLMYTALSRARVHSTVIFYNYCPGLCRVTDEFIQAHSCQTSKIAKKGTKFTWKAGLLEGLISANNAKTFFFFFFFFFFFCFGPNLLSNCSVNWV